MFNLEEAKKGIAHMLHTSCRVCGKFTCADDQRRDPCREDYSRASQILSYLASKGVCVPIETQGTCDICHGKGVVITPYFGKELCALCQGNGKLHIRKVIPLSELMKEQEG